MSFTEAIRAGFSNYVAFNGRATRPEFWWWVLFVLVAGLIFNLLDGAIIAPLLGFAMFAENAGQPLSLIFSLATLLPSLAVAIRRLHDINRTGWWILIGLIPLIGLIVLIYFYVQPSEDEDNLYG